MPDPIAHLATPLPDGSIASRYTELPDGSWAPVTDTDDAPCCCDVGGDCWIRLMPCFCNDPGMIHFVRLTQAINDVWTPDLREAGTAVGIAGTCWVFYGTQLGPVPQERIILPDAGEPIVYANCYETPCANQTPCPPCGGGASRSRFGPQFPCNVPSSRDFSKSCLQRVIAESIAQTSTRRTSWNDGVLVSENIFSATIASRYVYELQGGNLRVTQWSVTVSASYESYWIEQDPRRRFYDYSNTYNQSNPGNWGFPVPNLAEVRGDALGSESDLFVPRLDDSGNAPSWVTSNPSWHEAWTSAWNPPPGNPFPCNGSAEVHQDSVSGFTDWTAESSVNFGDSGSSYTISSTRDAVFNNGDSRTLSENSGSRRTTIRWIHIGDDYDPDEDECELTDDGGGGGGNPGGPTQGPGGTDAGGADPSDINLTAPPVDPALQAEIARQSMMRTGQFPGRCPSCGG